MTSSWAVVVLGKHRGRWMSESSVVYRVNSRIAKATQRNPVLKKQTKKPSMTRAN